VTSGLTPTEAHELRVLNFLDELYGKLYAFSYNPRLDPSGIRYGTVAKMIEHYERELVKDSTRYGPDERPVNPGEERVRGAETIVRAGRRHFNHRLRPRSLAHQRLH
jgi:hypothetical protein